MTYIPAMDECQSSAIQRLEDRSYVAQFHGQQLDKILIKDVPVLSFTVLTAHVVRDLGAVLDSELTLAAYIAAKCKAGYYQLR
jgi:hypothetical protein